MINIKNASLIGLIFAMIAMCILVFRESLFGVGPTVISIQVFAGLIMLWSRVTFGKRSFHASASPTSGGLITTGPYKFIRHPIYASILYFTWAGISAHFSIINILLGVTVTAGLFIRILAEERLVGTLYPNYLLYAARTKRIIPYIF
jgi:protein-S-isoprenylcysteine O-methyltransferase Ste14